jgi:hypothetical protein
LCMSQIYKHLQTEPRHKTLSNLLWMFINEYEKREPDDRILEALKVGRVRDNIHFLLMKLLFSLMMISFKH